MEWSAAGGGGVCRSPDRGRPSARSRRPVDRAWVWWASPL